MTEYETILADVEGGIGRITINRPDSRNSLNTQVLGDARSVLAEFRYDDSVGVVVFTGAEDKAFAAGADIRELKERTMFDALSSVMQAVCDEIEAYEKPTIAAVNGVALGGGCELAMACDIRLASENAKFGQPEVGLSIIPGAGGTQRLARLIGKGRATEMILTGRMMDAAEAERSGLVSRVVPAPELLSDALKTAETIASMSLPIVMMTKETINRAYETTLTEGIRFERRVFHAMFATADQKEGMAAFVEKRAPNFGNR